MFVCPSEIADKLCRFKVFSVQFYMQASKYLVKLIPPNLNNQCTFDIGTLYYIFEKKVDK